MPEIIAVLCTVVGLFVAFEVSRGIARGDIPHLLRRRYRRIGQRGPALGYSAALDDIRWDGTPYTNEENTESWTGRDLRQIHVPMMQMFEAQMRAFYLGPLGMVEMRAPDAADGLQGFWAASGTRQVYFGPTPAFRPEPGEMPGFVIPDLDAVAARLVEAGHTPILDNSLAYVRRLLLTDPAGNQIALIGA